ncbi:MAG: hypothetical protein ABIS50_16975 [Luteolibacter sp.]|uniref:hypothetical protein n=1 Tax=Luteolibacter sp. TaxID=1962973 RepID=UPI003263C42B
MTLRSPIAIVSILNRVFSLFGAVNPSLFKPRPVRDIAGFFRIFATTLFEGFILSFFLIMISFCALIYLQTCDRKRIFAVADPG